ncbi:Conserved hypothetical protein [Herminiimonas arsenicoxydans]|uniref:Uncharacterized protein n=1 Tax=Herminiimonas arsenicoxydans TaxID=204773 RepID=A4G2I3_HERAR|nr:Conserved hypothetical protein [Herminiimonas arsenicoxydans]
MNVNWTNALRVVGGACVLAALAACGQEKILDQRHVEVVNGKIYEEGANEPFNGKLTNVSGLSTPVLNRIVSQLKTAAHLGLGKHLEHPLQRYFCDVDIRAGLFDGKAICRLPQSEIVMSEIAYVKGSAEGPATLYVPGKSDVLVAATFKDGELDDKLEVSNPSNGKLVLRQKWKVGVPHGKLVQYLPDGSHLIYTNEATDGVKDGIEESFDRQTGKRTGRGEWRSGKPHGNFQQWGADGNLLNDKVYKDGVLVEDRLQAAQPAVAGLNTDSCVDQWTAARRKEVGPDAPISFDQLDEWREWCKAGKAPH